MTGYHKVISPEGAVIVAHPGRQYSHQLARALHEADLLAAYWTGIPVRRLFGPFVPAAAWNRVVKYAALSLPSDRVRYNMAAAVVNNSIVRLSRPRHAAVFGRCAERFFDRWAAKRLRTENGVGAVVCYENSAFYTFQKAKRRGIVTILDAASVHHKEQDRLYPYIESPALHRQITANKDVEIALADHILCLSTYARESYLSAGVPAKKVDVVRLGADIELFTTNGQCAREGRAKEHVFCFVGGFSRRKGGDVLTAALERVLRRIPNARLVVMGRVAAEFVGVLRHPRITVTGHLHQGQLAAELQKMDTLVLPSRHDSFGMVVVEAMACGVPVIVSDSVGAKDLVREGENGWIVPVEDTDALANAMVHAVEALRARPEIRLNARRTAEESTWKAYRERVVELIAEWLRDRAAMTPTAR